MKYEGIMLELLSRVQILEEQMLEVKAELSALGDEYEEKDEGDRQDKITRSQARAKAIEIIQKLYPDYVVNKASRKEGSGIKVHKPNSKRPLIIKLYHSKTFPHRSGEFEHGWHVVRLNDEIGSIADLCLFSMVDSSGNWSFFIYEPGELGMYYEANRSSEIEILHLYFVVKDDKAMEVREDKVDVTDHLNNWTVIKTTC